MKPQPSICIITSLYPPAVSGSAIHCVELGRNLTKQGCRVTIITAKLDPASPDRETAEGVEIFRLPAIRLPKLPIALNFPWLNLSFSPANLRRVLNILQENPPDVLHLHNHMFDSAFLAVSASRRLNIPLALSVHTIIKHTNPIHDVLLQLADRFILKHLVVRKSRIVICQDEIVETYVRRTFGHQNTRLIPYGIDALRKPDPQKVETLRKKYEVGDGPVLLSLGHLHETRSRKELIEALPKLLKFFPKLKLLIVGYVGTNSARKRAETLGVESSVICTGAVPHADVPEFLALADVEAHWFDQKHPHKTPGIAGQEVLMAGKAMMTRAVEDVYGKGILMNNENVMLVNPHNLDQLVERLAWILSDRQARQKMESAASLAARQHFSWDVICNRMIDAYKSIQA